MIRGETTRGHEHCEANLGDSGNVGRYGEDNPWGYLPLNLTKENSVDGKSFLISGKVRSTLIEVQVFNLIY